MRQLKVLHTDYNSEPFSVVAYTGSVYMDSVYD